MRIFEPETPGCMPRSPFFFARPLSNDQFQDDFRFHSLNHQEIFYFNLFQEVIMKSLNIVTGVLLSFTVGTAIADAEMSSLVQWEESQTGQTTVLSASDNDIVKNINTMEASAAGQDQLSSLVQWEESQYAESYAFAGQSDTSIVKNINSLDASAAGAKQDDMSSLIQWEESF